MTKEIEFKQPIFNKDGKLEFVHFWGYIESDKIFTAPITNFGFQKSYSFTGLFDKNGKKIYEGDIIESNLSGEEIYGKEIFVKLFLWEVVKIDPLEPIIGRAFSPNDNSWIEHVVIGNIYENPELIGGINDIKKESLTIAYMSGSSSRDDEIKALKAENEKLKSSMEWQPIETSPTGNEVLILTNKGIFQAIKRGVNWLASDSTLYGKIYIVAEKKTHWMPLPNLPQIRE